MISQCEEELNSDCLPSFYRIGTWNLLGASLPLDQQAIDYELCEQNIDILGVQETMTPSQFINTKDYKWYLSSGRLQDHGRSIRRGVGIVLRKSCNFKVEIIRRVSDRVLSVKIKDQRNKDLFLIVVHLPSKESELEKVHSLLSNEVNRLSTTQMNSLILIGDFNAHLGKDLLGDKSKGIIGNALLHSVTNEPGRYLMDFLKHYQFKVNTTYGRHNAIETWRRGTSFSQLDHIITSGTSLFFVDLIKGLYFARSDHKLVSARFTIKNNNSRNNRKIMAEISMRQLNEVNALSTSTSSPVTSTPNGNMNNKKHLRWDMSLLKDQDKRSEFKDKLLFERQKLGAIKSWKDFSDLVSNVSNNVLVREKPILTPRRKSALDDLKRTLILKRKSLTTQSEVQMKRRKLESEWNRFRNEECTDFFKNLNDFSYNERIKKTFQFIRNFRRNENKKGSKLFIPMTSWTRLLEEVAGPSVPLIEETDNFPLLPPPTEKELLDVIAKMKSGKAPGTDKITIDILKVLPSDLYSDLLQIIQEIWINNAPPDEWRTTLQFPIPKKAKPTTPGDFRRITLTNVIYRVISYIFLQRLDSMIPALGDYQAAFLHNRSADDHIYTLRRVLEEEWNVGNYLMVASLDLEKAFDNVDLRVAVIILKGLGIPHHFINRIIHICMWEQTKVLWFNQTTPSVNKSKGVKQGCPLSPRIFTLVLDAIITTLAEELNISLKFENELGLPLILAYADDLVIISRSKQQIKAILQKLFELLETVGLKCNTNKSYIVLRDPLNNAPEAGEFVDFGDFKLKVSDEVRYLGKLFCIIIIFT